jgi:hypothetical protein
LVTLADNSDATDFITAWSAAGIPYTEASVATDGSIILTHTEGGEILLNDTVNSVGVNTGISNGLINEAGFIINTTTGVTTNITGGATYTNQGWIGGVLAPDGNIYSGPYFSSSILKITFSGLSQLPSLRYCLSPWTNKF